MQEISALTSNLFRVSPSLMLDSTCTVWFDARKLSLGFQSLQTVEVLSSKEYHRAIRRMPLADLLLQPVQIHQLSASGE